MNSGSISFLISTAALIFPTASSKETISFPLTNRSVSALPGLQEISQKPCLNHGLHRPADVNRIPESRVTIAITGILTALHIRWVFSTISVIVISPASGSPGYERRYRLPICRLPYTPEPRPSSRAAAWQQRTELAFSAFEQLTQDGRLFFHCLPPEFLLWALFGIGLVADDFFGKLAVLGSSFGCRKSQSQ